MLREAFRGVYPVLRLSHRRPFGDPKSGEEIVLANLENYDEVDAVMEGVDAVIHLGGKAEEGTWDVVLKSNILGAFNTFEAARRHGVKRFVFASINHLVGSHRRDRKLTVGEPPVSIAATQPPRFSGRPWHACMQCPFRFSGLGRQLRAFFCLLCQTSGNRNHSRCRPG